MISELIDYRKICDDPLVDDTLDRRIIREFTIPNERGLFVCLTFDDGPTIDYTPRILDLLKVYEAKATFFVLGEFVKYFPEVALRIVEEGHEIGNHTFSHPDLTLLTPLELQDEICRTEDVIASVTNSRCQLFRPTYGVFYAETIDLVEKLGYKLVLWSKDMFIKDWEQPGVSILAAKVMTKIKNGSNILLHDGGGDREQTIEALKSIIPILIEQGYQFITVSKMIEMFTMDAG